MLFNKEKVHKLYFEQERLIDKYNSHYYTATLLHNISKDQVWQNQCDSKKMITQVKLTNYINKMRNRKLLIL